VEDISEYPAIPKVVYLKALYSFENTFWHLLGNPSALMLNTVDVNTNNQMFL